MIVKVLIKIFSNFIKSLLFSNLALNLSKITDDIDLLKGTSGFFKIGDQCNGGRINKALHKTKMDYFSIL